MTVRIVPLMAALVLLALVSCTMEEEPGFVAGDLCDMAGMTACDYEMTSVLECTAGLVWQVREYCVNGCSDAAGYAACIGGGSPDNWTNDNDSALPDTSDNQLPDLTETTVTDDASRFSEDDTLPDDAVEVEDDTVDDDAVEVEDDVVADDAAEIEDDVMADDAAELEDDVVADDAAELEDDVVTDDAPVTDDDSIPAVVVTYDFNDGVQGWTHTAVDGYSGATDWPYDFWEQGARNDGASCHEGAGCWGTNLDGNYINCQRAELRSPVIDLSAYAAQTVTLYVWQSRDFWDNGTYFDGGILEFSGDGGSTWINGCASCSGTVNIRGSSGISYSCNSKDSFYVDDEKGFVQTTGGWVNTYFTVPAGVLTANFRMRFVYSTGVSVGTTSTDPADYSHKGWYLDDISIEAQ